MFSGKLSSLHFLELSASNVCQENRAFVLSLKKKIIFSKS